MIVVAANFVFVGVAAMADGSLDPRLNILGTALLPSFGCVLLAALGVWLYGERTLPVDMRPRSHRLGAVLMGIAGVGFATIATLYLMAGSPLTDFIGVAYFFPAACLSGASVVAIANAILRS